MGRFTRESELTESGFRGAPLEPKIIALDVATAEVHIIIDETNELPDGGTLGGVTGLSRVKRGVGRAIGIRYGLASDLARAFVGRRTRAEIDKIGRGSARKGSLCREIEQQFVACQRARC